MMVINITLILVIAVILILFVKKDENIEKRKRITTSDNMQFDPSFLEDSKEIHRNNLSNLGKKFKKRKRVLSKSETQLF